MNCLWCMEEITHSFSWTDVFFLKKHADLCDECQSRLEFIKGDRCKICSRKTSEQLCPDCRDWQQRLGEDPLLFNHSLLHYNPFIQEVIAKWKYRGDYILGEIFRPFLLHAFKERFHRMEKDLIAVPIPLSKDRLLERGFNQAEMLARFLPLEMKNVLQRIDGEKQSKKSRKARISSENPFFLSGTVKESVLVVDYIYTTGVTLRHAASLLKQHGCPNVYALTLIRGG